ncbi:hypothetical protein NCG97_30115 [Streptomyces lydicamycinicus]|uniref:hypothetical protein n=1 Tax=Streptomyces lydicamycinicus TaxID=1546107 RepID=UPI0020361E82|nr:hypothetical protein [Streptomyces lydicamycinicus]USA03897.1 hypothetical protein NCG97_30115 [Streptomyces lydicamycinicus]
MSYGWCGASDRARAAAEKALGNFAAHDLLHRIGRFSEAEGKLAELAARVRAAFTPPDLPAVFTGRHLHLLVGPAAQPLLAEPPGVPGVRGVRDPLRRASAGPGAAGDGAPPGRHR